MKIKNVKVYSLEESMIRSGYPMQVGEPEDLQYIDDCATYKEFAADEDVYRASKLGKAPTGTGHDNFLKGIIVQFDLQYPEYFSPQLQRYNWIDIVSSQSKMHKLTSRELTSNDFTPETHEIFISAINALILDYKNSPNPNLFREIISNLPSGYLKWMGISTNYLQLKTIYFQRKSHKLDEWGYFCNWIKGLPMFKELVLNKNNK